MINNTIDTIWRNAKGRWCYKTLAGDTWKYDTKEQAIHSRNVWQPQLTRLYLDKYIKKDDTILLKFYGNLNPFELKVAGNKGRSLIFSHEGQQFTLKQIKELVAKRQNKKRVDQVGLNYGQTTHVPSGKSIKQLKQDYLSEKREATKANQEAQPSFDFLSTLNSPAEQPKEILESNIFLGKESFDISKFQQALRAYEEVQYNFLSEINISQEAKLKCYKESLIMFISTISDSE